MRLLLAIFHFVFILSSAAFSQEGSIRQLPLQDALIHNEKQFSLANKFLEIDLEKSNYHFNQIILDRADFSDSTLRSTIIQKLELLPQIYGLEQTINQTDSFLLLLDKRKDTLGMAMVYEFKSEVLLKETDLIHSMEALLAAIEIYEQLDDSDKVGELLLKKGAIQYSSGNYIKSIETVFNAADKFKETGSKYYLAFSYLQIGITYLYIEQYEKSLANYKLARDEFLSFDDSLGAAVCNSNIALVYIKQDQYEPALRILLKAINIIYSSDRDIAISQALHNIGFCYNGINDQDSALFYLRKSLSIDKKIGYALGEGSNYLQIAKVNNKLGNIDSVLYFGNKALEILKESPDVNIESEASLLMALAYYNSGYKEKSSSYFFNYISLQDSIIKKSKLLDKIAHSQGDKLEKYRNELLMAQERESLNKNKNESQRKLIFILAIAGLLLVLVLIQMLVINLRNKKLNKTLSTNQKIIENDLSVKKSLLNEIHHRVKNNLQVISSMLSIQTQYISDPQLTKILEESKARINSMALIHESLYKRDTNDITSFNSYIKDLIPRLIETYQVDEQKISLKMDLDDIQLSIDESIPCGLLLNELISNSLKHAFPDDKKGEIRISMKRLENNSLNLKISDNGVGLPDTVIPDNQDSFGFLLIYTLALQLEAEMSVETESGLSFSFIWKERDYTMLS